MVNLCLLTVVAEAFNSSTAVDEDEIRSLMMLLGAGIKKLQSSQRPLFTISRCLRVKLNISSVPEAKVFCSLDEECDNFLSWLEQKAGAEISLVLSIGKSAYGRSLFASKIIQTGDCILKVPYSVQITPDNLPLKIKSLLTDEVGNISKLAVAILIEQKMGQVSQWTPYISCLPQHGEIHSTIFWNEDELDMIRCSSVYRETINQKAQIEKEFSAVMLVLKHFPEVLGSMALNDFMHAYASVGSRAWGSSKGLSLIPFADFLNHDGVSQAIVLSDDDKQLSEVVADRNYAPGEEVLIRYGRFPNSTLLLDFGFTLSYNIHDEVQIRMSIPNDDSLLPMKLELLQRHRLRTCKGVTDFNSYGDAFTIKEVKSSGKGKGIPQSLRAFARVLCCTSPQELSDLSEEAAQSDGRLARRPFRDSSREIQAHQILLLHITQVIEEYDSSIKSLDRFNSPSVSERFALRRQMARDLLMGELRILKSAASWLSNYCTTLHTDRRTIQL